MTPKEAVEVILVGRRVAARSGGTYTLDPARMVNMGFTREKVAEIEVAADKIEEYTASVLRSLAHEPRGDNAERD